MIMDTDLVIRSDRSSAQISVGGYVSEATASTFASVLTRDVLTLSAGNNPIELDFAELELCDGQAVAQAVNALRELSRERPVVIANSPQMLAHTLYKAGLLDEGRLRLITPQREEGAAN